VIANQLNNYYLIIFNMNHFKKYLTEFIATGLFALAIGVSAFNPAFMAAPVIAGITLALFVYVFGSISGTHINPAVTLGLLSLRKISVKDAVGYIVAQLLGGLAALYIGKLFVPELGAIPAGTIEITTMVFFAEMIGAIVFGMGIAAAVYDKVSKSLSGAVIGGSLVIGLGIAASAGSLGILNPAVAITIGAFNFVYIAGPIAGMLIGMQFYKWVSHMRNA
jgi:aquaporin Z